MSFNDRGLAANTDAKSGSGLCGADRSSPPSGAGMATGGQAPEVIMLAAVICAAGATNDAIESDLSLDPRNDVSAGLITSGGTVPGMRSAGGSGGSGASPKAAASRGTKASAVPGASGRSPYAGRFVRADTLLGTVCSSSGTSSRLSERSSMLSLHRAMRYGPPNAPIGGNPLSDEKRDKTNVQRRCAILLKPERPLDRNNGRVASGNHRKLPQRLSIDASATATV